MMPQHNVDFEKIGQQSAEMLEQFLQHTPTEMQSTNHITRAFVNLSNHMMQNPEKIMEAQLGLFQNYLKLWAHTTERMMGVESEAATTPKKGDRRFNHESWEEHLVFDYIKQSYLLTSEWVVDTIMESKHHLDPQEHAKVDFYIKQFLDAMSPSNFPLTNPEVLEKTIETKGENLVNGLKNILTDLERGNGKLKISMTDYDAFEIGKNIATQPGEVVYRNRMLEIIQYKPKGKTVHERPLLIFPPWINKFYILDLQEKNSFVRWAVEECGLNVFLVSWKNVDESYRDVGFEDYMEEGVFDAIEQVTNITGSKDVNAIGYCIGGTLLSSSLAVMAKKKDKRVHSATFFTTLMDFTDAGEINVFIDDEQVTELEKKMDKDGYLHGSEMAATFSMLRSNDLIWSFVVNNYLMGNDPFPFDLLYWNDDPTRLPAKMHSYYLRNMYIENNLVKKNKLKMCGEKVDLSEITQDIYMVTGVNDHITPWESCYAPLASMKGDSRFILGRAGHVAGVVCPPKPGKGKYWADNINGEKNPTKWQKSATEHDGSWWQDWKPWIKKKSGKQIDAPKKLGGSKHKPLCAAPGTYVTER